MPNAPQPAPAPQTKEWIVDTVDPETGEFDRGAMQQCMIDCEAIGHREGGTFQLTPIKEEVPVEGADPAFNRKEYVVLGWHVKHSFAPPVRRSAPPAEIEAEPEVVDAEPVPA